MNDKRCARCGKNDCEEPMAFSPDVNGWICLDCQRSGTVRHTGTAMSGLDKYRTWTRTEEEVKKRLAQLMDYQERIGRDHWEYGYTWREIHMCKWFLNEPN